MEVHHGDTPQKKGLGAALTHGRLYQKGRLNSGSENKPVSRNSRSCCLVLKPRWVGSRSQSWQGFLSHLSPSPSRFPLEHPVLSGCRWEHSSVCSSPALSLILLLLRFCLCQQSPASPAASDFAPASPSGLIFPALGVLALTQPCSQHWQQHQR